MSFAEHVLRELRVFFEPIEEAVSSAARLKAFLTRFGHNFADGDAQTALAGLASLRIAIGELAQRLGERDREDGDATPSAAQPLDTADLVRLGEAVRRAFTALRQLPALLPSAASTAALFAELWDYLAAAYLFERAPPLYRVLVLLGVIELETLIPGVHADARVVPYLRTRIHWARAGRFLKDPSAAMREVYGWSTADFDPTTLLTRLADVLDEFGLDTAVRRLDPALESRFLPPQGLLSLAVGVELPLLQQASEDETTRSSSACSRCRSRVSRASIPASG